MKFIDMHTHSTASDGVYSPSQLIDYAIQKGLSGIAITDHDTVDGIEEAIEQADTYDNFILIPGVELSTEYKGDEVHILGYMIDYKADSLLSVLEYLQSVRNSRAIKIVNRLRDLGLKIDYKGVAQIADGGVIGRPHIARFLIEKGYVATIEEAFVKYLGKNALAYVPKERLTPKSAIDIIRKAKGISVVAHPGLLKRSQPVLEHLLNIGIDGIEVYHSEHTIEQSVEYLNLARQNNLLVTGGSDFHYPPQDNEYNGDLGSIKIPLKNIEDMLETLKV